MWGICVFVYIYIITITLSYHLIQIKWLSKKKFIWIQISIYFWNYLKLMKTYFKLYSAMFPIKKKKVYSLC